jgi:hypothetical protein
MRKFLIALVILILVMIGGGAAWIFGGRPLSLRIDRFKTVQTGFTPIETISYEGSGSGGLLHINDMTLSLSPADPQSPSPEMGTTKDGQLALSFDRKVFPFGPVQSASGGSGESLAARRPKSDEAAIAIRHSALAWPTLLDFNFMTGQSPSWKRHRYYDLTWTKQDGAKLEMVWRYEQYFYPSQGWTSGLMTREGETGLIRVDIQK